MKFRKGQKVEFFCAERWVPGVITFVWRAMELETNKRVYLYDVQARNDLGFPVDMVRCSEDLFRRPNAARGRKKVLRSHSVKMERFT